jgi:hypothetical protein
LKALVILLLASLPACAGKVSPGSDSPAADSKPLSAVACETTKPVDILSCEQSPGCYPLSLNRVTCTSDCDKKPKYVDFCTRSDTATTDEHCLVELATGDLFSLGAGYPVSKAYFRACTEPEQAEFVKH